MARIDEYLMAKKLAVQTLSEQSLENIIRQSGFKSDNKNSLKINFLDRVYQVSFPDFDFLDAADEKKNVPIQEQVLLLHYMLGDSFAKASDEWIAYREIPGASFYFGPFAKRTIEPLKKVFGQNIEALKKSAALLNGKPIDIGDGGFEFQMLPHLAIRLILWEGDDEFAPEANILFQEKISRFFPAEDAAWFAGMLVYRLIALTK